MLSRQDGVDVHGAAAGGAGGKRAPKARSPGRGSGDPPQIFFEKLIAGNAFFKHFKRFLVTLKEWVIPRKRWGEMDSDQKMNQTERCTAKCSSW